MIKKLKERLKSLSGNMNENMIKKDIEEIETINIKHLNNASMDHRVSKLIAENEHLKQTYRQLYNSIKPARIRSKEQSLKNDLRKLKGKALADNVVTKHTIDLEMLKIDVEYLNPRLLNNRSAHSDYLKQTQEEAVILREIVEQGKSQNPLNTSLDSACRKHNHKISLYIKPMLSSTGVKLSTSASGSQPSGNTKKDKIQQTPSSTQKNKVEAQPRKVKSSLKNKDCVVAPKGTANVQHSKLNANSELKCVVKVWKPTGKVFTNIGYIWRPTGRTFTVVGNACPLTRITKTTEVPLKKPTALDHETPKPVVTLVYSQKPRKSKTNIPVSKSMVVQIVLWYLDSGCSKHMTGDRSQLTNFVNKFLGTVKFRNDHVVKILGYGDYHIRNVTISRVYYVEGLGHNLFSVGKFCDSNLEVAFRQHTCFIRILEGVDLLIGSQGNNLYTLSLRYVMASSLICLLSKASKTKSWLWHRRLSHLNFGAINLLARHGLIQGKKKPHKPKSEDTNQEKLYLLHMDLCGPMRVTSVKGKKYILVIVDDYSRFTWVKFLRQKQLLPHVTPKIIPSENLGKLQPKDDIDIFIVYAPTKKAFQIYNRHTRRIIETIHVDFDELTAIVFEHSSSGPALHEMTPVTISSGVVPNPPPSTPFVPSSRIDWDILFQPMFDELLTPSPSGYLT
ncbi:integrase, catalytic region, zinc finger, CCHC-type containing protein [Tanacetum coccineum]